MGEWKCGRFLVLSFEYFFDGRSFLMEENKYFIDLNLVCGF